MADFLEFSLENGGKGKVAVNNEQADTNKITLY